MQPDRNRHVDTIHILVADNSPFHTQLLVGALSREADLKVYSSNLDAASVLSSAIAHKIDVFILSAFVDIDGDAERGLRILRELRETNSNIRAVILLDSSKTEAVLESFRAGARGVFDHQESPEALCQCIRQVHAGKVWINDEQIAHVLDSLASAPKLKAVDAKGISLLSKREADVVRCVTEGLTNREIAERLGLSQHTIKNHLFRIFDKLGVSNRIELLFVTLSQGSTEAATPLPGLLNVSAGEYDEASLAMCEKAAEGGVLAAQLMLAVNSERAKSSSQDSARSYLWLSIALDQLTRNKNRMKKMMTSAQLAEAERQIQERLSKWEPVDRPVAAQRPSAATYERTSVA